MRAIGPTPIVTEQLALTPHVQPLRQPTREEVQRAVDAITAVLAHQH